MFTRVTCCVYWRIKLNDVVIVVDVAYLHEDDVSEMTSGLAGERSVPVTSSHVLALDDNCLHHHPTADRRQSNRVATSSHTLSQAEQDEFCGSTNTSSLRNEGNTASSSEKMTASKSTVSDVKKQNYANDSDATEIKSEPLLKFEVDTACESDIVLVTGKRRLRFKRFKGIGPTDEATGIPIASRTVSKTYIYIIMHMYTYIHDLHAPQFHVLSALYVNCKY